MLNLCKACAGLSRSSPMTLKQSFLALCSQKNRKFSLSSARPGTKGALKVKIQQTNLQKRKHLKYSEEFIQKQVGRYKLSKRRLANMMGEDPDTFTEEDVDKAIRYLLPSDLEEDSAPSLKHPDKVFTSRLKIHWDETGRPHHYLYYMMNQNCNELLHQIYQRILDVRSITTAPTEDDVLDLSGTRWMSKEELNAEILDGENAKEGIYRRIIAQFERLLEEPHAYKVESFIMQHRKKIPIVSMMGDVKEPEILDDGRRFVVEKGQKKTAISEVKLIQPGSGQIVVNGKPFFRQFFHLEDRQTVLAPLCFLGMLGQFDMEVKLQGGLVHSGAWHSPARQYREGYRAASQAQATRHALARALRCFISNEDTEMLRRAGLLTLDKRWRERKLPGQHKARKKHTWKKR